MNLVYVDGPEATILGLRDIPDIILELVSGQSLPGGQIRVTVYATDRAITEIQGRGATVTVLMDNEALEDHLNTLYQAIEESEPPVV